MPQSTRSLIRWTVGIACVLLATGCVHPQAITVSEPKIYLQEDVLRALGEYRANIKGGATNLPLSTLQELLDVQQLSRNDIQTSASPTGANLVSAPNALAFPDLQFRQPVGVIKDLGLPARALLRNLAVNQQLIMGYDLLFKGDARFVGVSHQVVLVRLDVSINDYLRKWHRRDFALVLFAVEALCMSKPCGEDVQVYSLFPEYTATTAQESLLTSAMNTVASQAGTTIQAVDVKAALRRQTAVQEQLTNLVEYPAQFAIYEPFELPCSKSFAVAFGPRRRIEKRGLYNPARWFGEPYTIDHEIEPGPRDLYALLLVPRDADQLRITARPIPYLAPEGRLGEVFQAIQGTLARVGPTEDRCPPADQDTMSKPAVKSQPSSTDEMSAQSSSPARSHMSGALSPKSSSALALRPYELPGQAIETAVVISQNTSRQTSKSSKTGDGDLLDEIQRDITKTLRPLVASLAYNLYLADKLYLTAATSTRNLLPASPPPDLDPSRFECKVSPQMLAVTMASSVVISCSQPLTHDTDVQLGPLSIPREQVAVLNRYQLRVTLAPTKALEAVARADGDQLTWSVISAGRVAEATKSESLSSLATKVVLAPSESPFTLNPSSAQAGTQAKIILAAHLARNVTEVWIGNKKGENVTASDDRTLSITIPDPGNQIPTAALPVAVVVRRQAPPGADRLIQDKAFTYITPK